MEAQACSPARPSKQSAPSGAWNQAARAARTKPIQNSSCLACFPAPSSSATTLRNCEPCGPSFASAKVLAPMPPATRQSEWSQPRLLLNHCLRPPIFRQAVGRSQGLPRVSCFFASPLVSVSLCGRYLVNVAKFLLGGFAESFVAFVDVFLGNPDAHLEQRQKFRVHPNILHRAFGYFPGRGGRSMKHSDLVLPPAGSRACSDRGVRRQGAINDDL